MNEADHFIAEILGFFESLEPWVFGIANEAKKLAGLDRPGNDSKHIYALSDHWGVMGDHLGSVVDVIGPAGEVLVTDWTGASSTQWLNVWRQLYDGLAQTQQAALSSGQGVAEFAIEIDRANILFWFALLLLAWMVFQLVLMMIRSGGLSLSGVAPAMQATRETLVTVGQRALAVIGSISIEKIGPAVLEFIFKELPNFVEALPELMLDARQAAPKSLPEVVDALSTAGKSTAKAGWDALTYVPKTIIAKTFGEQWSGQWFLSMMRSPAMKALARTAGKQAWQTARQALMATRYKVAEQYSAQLLGQWGVRGGTALAEEELTAALTRALGEDAAKLLGEQALREFAAQRIGGMTFGRGLVAFFAPRMASGAALMGLQELITEIILLPRTHSLDLVRVLQSSLQGAAFSVGMVGGTLTHAIGGGTVGAFLAAGQDLFTAVQHGGYADDQGHQIDWWKTIFEGTVSGAGSAVLFSTFAHLEAFHFPVPESIGRNLTLISEEGGLRMRVTERGLTVDISEKGISWAQKTDTGVTGGELDAAGKIRPQFSATPSNQQPQQTPAAIRPTNQPVADEKTTSTGVRRTEPDKVPADSPAEPAVAVPAVHAQVEAEVMPPVHAQVQAEVMPPVHAQVQAEVTPPVHAQVQPDVFNAVRQPGEAVPVEAHGGGVGVADRGVNDSGSVGGSGVGRGNSDRGSGMPGSGRIRPEDSADPLAAYQNAFGPDQLDPTREPVTGNGGHGTSHPLDGLQHEFEAGQLDPTREPVTGNGGHGTSHPLDGLQHEFEAGQLDPTREPTTSRPGQTGRAATPAEWQARVEQAVADIQARSDQRINAVEGARPDGQATGLEHVESLVARIVSVEDPAARAPLIEELVGRLNDLGLLGSDAELRWDVIRASGELDHMSRPVRELIDSIASGHDHMEAREVGSGRLEPDRSPERLDADVLAEGENAPPGEQHHQPLDQPLDSPWISPWIRRGRRPVRRCRSSRQARMWRCRRGRSRCRPPVPSGLRSLAAGTRRVKAGRFSSSMVMLVW